jgi:hypothetical protein
MGSIIKFQLQKTIASPPPEIPKKRKKSVGTPLGPFVSDKYRVRQKHLSRLVRPGCAKLIFFPVKKNFFCKTNSKEFF